MNKPLIGVFFLGCLFLALGCAAKLGWQPNARDRVSANSLNISPQTKYLKKNILETDYTAVVYVTAVKKGRQELDYVGHIYKATVLETIKGAEYKEIQLTGWADLNAALSMPNYPVIVSLCGEPPNHFFTPDNGYVLPATDEYVEFAKKLVTQKNNADSDAIETVCR